MAKESMDALQTKYNEFLVPMFKVSVEESDLRKQDVFITSVLAESSLGSVADALTMEIGDCYDFKTKGFTCLDKLVIGKNIKVEMGYEDTLTTVFNGIITSVECNYEAEEMPTLSVKAMNKVFFMMRGKKSKTWMNMKYSAIVSEIGGSYFSKLDVDSTDIEYEIVEQYEESDFNFIKALAVKCNYDFFIENNKLHFTKALPNKSATVSLSFGKHLRSFSIQADLSGQVEKVVVRGLDKKNFTTIVSGEASSISKVGSGAKTGVDMISSVAPGKTDMYVYRNVNSAEDAKNIAQGILDAISMEYVSGTGQSIGVPELKAGDYVELDGLGDKMNNVYYLKSVSHKVDATGYVTNFTVGGNAL